MAARLQLDAMAAERHSPEPSPPDSSAKLEKRPTSPPPKTVGRKDRDRLIAVANSIGAQARKRDWVTALTRELAERRFVAQRLITEALRLLPADERRRFVDLAMQQLDYFEQGPAVPAA
jgi:hypothetical protein